MPLKGASLGPTGHDMEMLCKIKHLFDTSDTAREHTNETSAVSAKTLDEKIPQSIIITQAIQTRL